MQENATDTLCYEIVLDLFESYRMKAGKILESFLLVDQALMIEIGVLQFTLADHVYASLGVDRRLFRPSAKEWLHAFALVREQHNIVYHRIDFYADILRGRKVRGDWALGVVGDLEESPVLRCLTAFGDILINPACGDDYDNAPAPRHSADLLIAFARDVMTRIFDLYDDFLRDVAGSIVPHPDPDLNFLKELRYAKTLQSFGEISNHLKRIALRASVEGRQFIDRVLCNPTGAIALLMEKIRELEMQAQTGGAAQPGDRPPKSAGATPGPAINRPTRMDLTPGIHRAPLFASGRPTREAINVYREITEKMPGYADGWCDLGCAYLETGRYVWAKEAFEKAHDISPNDKRALGNLALSQHEMLGLRGREKDPRRVPKIVQRRSRQEP